MSRREIAKDEREDLAKAWALLAKATDTAPGEDLQRPQICQGSHES